MFKLQNQFKIISFCLFVLLGILFITNNYYVMAMNNGHISQNNGHDNNHTNFQNQARILQNLNLQQARIVQQIFNARNNNSSEEVINNLVRQNIELSSRITAQQIILHNAMPQQNDQNQQNNPSRR
ncbi:SVM family protein [Columbia Basin potato purple top phytoplasma]|uniref:SVM family protein n=1 Tax=Columbia Basin potato purple top phytoplasma TaxID=307134 RepID=A0ABT5L9L7_9MOLU|nr:SVM family protein [Columbia Basin potato purple top phytoplasma]MDC9032285.1 SVM family protein [Columbia Basin potato purple top phytoplasma]